MSLPSFSGILLRHGQYGLFLRRSEKSKHWPLHWTLPGGKVETGEDPLDCALRETLEEVGIQVHGKSILGSIEVNALYIDGEKHITLYMTDTWEGMPENLELAHHSEMLWVDLKELPYPMIPHITVGIEGLLSGKSSLSYHAI
jgi:8-oxo-dGTP diphosphatase